MPTEPAFDRRRASHARGGGRLHAFSVVGKVVAALVSIMLFAAFGYGWYNYRDLESGMKTIALPNLGAPQSTPSGSGAASETERHDVDGKTQNILIVGIDSRAGLSDAEKRRLHVGNADTLSTDSMMIVHVPAVGARATLISLPRDSFVDIPGWAKNKLNAAYANGYSEALARGRKGDDLIAAGADLLVQTVQRLTGLSIDHYVQVSFAGFYTITKAIGKIPVDLCHDVDDTITHNRETREGGGSGFKMSAGHHDLDAVQALEFVRQRHHLVGGDLARVKRQRYFLTAAFNRIVSVGVLANPGRLADLIDAIHGAFYVDQSFSLLALAEQMSALSGTNIVGRTIPTEGTSVETIVDRSESVTLVDPGKVRAFVARIVSEPGARANPGAVVSSPAAGPTSEAGRSTAARSGSTSAAARTGCVN